MDSALSNDPLCFIHLMKTAGASTRKYLESQFDHQDICQAWNPIDFEIESKDNLAQYKLFCGHIMGKQLVRFPQDTEYFTLLREPAGRLQSTYSWFRFLGRDYWGNIKRFVKRLIVKLSLKTKNTGVNTASEQKDIKRCIQLARELNFVDFVSSDDEVLETWLNNLTLRQLTSNGDDSAVYKDQSSDDTNIKYEHACKILDGCLVAGTQEKLMQAIELLCYRRNWPAPSALPNLHSTGNKKKLGSDEIAVISARNKIDSVLYDETSKSHLNEYDDLAAKAKGHVNISEFLDSNHKETVFNRLIEKEKIELSAEQAWPGIGWGLRGFNTRGNFWRFIGETGASTILTKLYPNKNYSLKILFHHTNFIPALIGKSVDISCNGVSIINAVKKNKINYSSIEAVLSKDYIKGDNSVEISISVTNNLMMGSKKIAISKILVIPQD